MSDLATWLRAQLDDDVETFDTLDSTALNGIESTAGWDVREYVERGRAEVDAKRRIIEAHRIEGGVCDQCFSPEATSAWDPSEIDLCDGCTTLRLLALPYADRPGYRDEWRPTA